VLDDRGVIILTNKAYRGFAERNGIEPGAVSEGINYLAVCDNASAEHSQEAAPFAEGIRAVLSGKLPSFELEYPCHSPDEKRWFVGRVTPIQGEGPRRVIVAQENITERKQLETERQKFFLLAESSSEFIGMCDLDMNPVYVNPAGRRMVGLPDMAAACRVKVQDYYFPEDQRFITEEFFPRVLRNGHGDVEIRLRHFQTGEPIWMFYYLFSVCDSGGTPVGWATVSRDITEPKRAEEKLIKQLDELQRWQDVMLDREDRVIELKKEVNELLARAGQPPRYPSAAAENSNGMPDGSQPLKEAEE
jgi:PAS domain S-box-containing protein